MGQKNITVAWKVDSNLSGKENQRKVEAAFDVLFDEVKRRSQKTEVQKAADGEPLVCL